MSDNEEPNSKRPKLNSDFGKKSEMELHDLPEEMIIHILSFLDVPDKKICCLVCKNWLELMQLPRLAKDMVFSFNNLRYCEGLEPYCIFMKSTRSFYTVEINLLFKIQDKTLFEKFCAIIGKKTKKLCVYFEDSYDDYGNVDNAQDRWFPGKYFQRVEELIVFRLKDIINIEDLPQSITKIRVSSIETHQDIKVVELLKTLPQLQTISAYSLELESLTNKSLFEFLKLSKDVEKFQDCLGVTIKNEVNIWKIDELQLEDLDRGLSIIEEDNGNLLEKINAENQNLDEVTYLMVEVLPCWFVHQLLPLPNLTYLHVPLLLRTSCDECLDYFLKSCPKFNSFCAASRNEEIYFEHLQKICQKNIKFRSIDLDSSVAFSFVDIFGDVPKQENFVDLTSLQLHNINIRQNDWSKWPKMLALKRLDIRSSDTDVCNNFEQIVEKCPQIRTFVLDGPKLSFEQIKVILKGWQYLSKIEANFDLPADNTDLIEALRNCKNLKKLYLQCSRIEPSEEDFDISKLELHSQMYRAVPTLRRIFFNKTRSSYRNFQHLNIMKT